MCPAQAAQDHFIVLTLSMFVLSLTQTLVFVCDVCLSFHFGLCCRKFVTCLFMHGMHGFDLSFNVN